MKRPLASALAFLIVALSPGAPAYQAVAQSSVGKTGGNAGSAGDAANSVNSGVNGGLSAPLAIPVQSLGLGTTLAPSAVAPTLNLTVNAAYAPAVSALAQPVNAIPALTQPAALNASHLSPAAVPGKAGRPVVPAALQPASKTAKGPGGLSAASKQTESLALTAKPVLEGVKNGDATLALNGVYENASTRGELGAVQSRSGTAALRSGLKKSAPSTEQQASVEVPVAAASVAKPGLWQRVRSTFDMSEFSKSEKSYILGQAVFLLAISVYLASLPLLVKALTGDARYTEIASRKTAWPRM